MGPTRLNDLSSQSNQRHSSTSSAATSSETHQKGFDSFHDCHESKESEKEFDFQKKKEKSKQVLLQSKSFKESRHHHEVRQQDLTPKSYRKSKTSDHISSDSETACRTRSPESRQIKKACQLEILTSRDLQGGRGHISRSFYEKCRANKRHVTLQLNGTCSSGDSFSSSDESSSSESAQNLCPEPRQSGGGVRYSQATSSQRDDGANDDRSIEEQESTCICSECLYKNAEEENQNSDEKLTGTGILSDISLTSVFKDMLVVLRPDLKPICGRRKRKKSKPVCPGPLFRSLSTQTSVIRKEETKKKKSKSKKLKNKKKSEELEESNDRICHEKKTDNECTTPKEVNDNGQCNQLNPKVSKTLTYTAELEQEPEQEQRQEREKEQSQEREQGQEQQHATEKRCLRVCWCLCDTEKQLADLPPKKRVNHIPPKRWKELKRNLKFPKYREPLPLDFVLGPYPEDPERQRMRLLKRKKQLEEWKAERREEEMKAELRERQWKAERREREMRAKWRERESQIKNKALSEPLTYCESADLNDDGEGDGSSEFDCGCGYSYCASEANSLESRKPQSCGSRSSESSDTSIHSYGTYTCFANETNNTESRKSPNPGRLSRPADASNLGSRRKKRMPLHVTCRCATCQQLETIIQANIMKNYKKEPRDRSIASRSLDNLIASKGSKCSLCGTESCLFSKIEKSYEICEYNTRKKEEDEPSKWCGCRSDTWETESTLAEQRVPRSPNKLTSEENKKGGKKAAGRRRSKTRKKTPVSTETRKHQRRKAGSGSRGTSPPKVSLTPLKKDTNLEENQNTERLSETRSRSSSESLSKSPSNLHASQKTTNTKYNRIRDSRVLPRALALKESKSDSNDHKNKDMLLLLLAPNEEEASETKAPMHSESHTKLKSSESRQRIEHQNFKQRSHKGSEKKGCFCLEARSTEKKSGKKLARKDFIVEGCQYIPNGSDVPCEVFLKVKRRPGAEDDEMVKRMENSQNHGDSKCDSLFMRHYCSLKLKSVVYRDMIKRNREIQERKARKLAEVKAKCKEYLRKYQKIMRGSQTRKRHS